MAAALIELSGKARRDLKRLGAGPERKRILDALTVGLATIPPPGNLDVKAIEGAAPYLRLRVGDYRILYCPLSPGELTSISQQRGQQAEAGYLVVRIVHRRDLERAVAALP
jgi:mRNA-degrading endonuclease RelE of RelBE toxin-antitoxin system